MVGDMIKQRRLELGMTQEELAKKMGYKHKTSISKIEDGKQDIMMSKVVEFAKALDTEPQDLMGWVETDEDRNEKSFIAIQRVKRLDSDRIDQLLRLMDALNM